MDRPPHWHLSSTSVSSGILAVSFHLQNMYMWRCEPAGSVAVPPVILQPAEFLPDGDGILAFSTAEEAITALAEVEQNYEHHAKSALEISCSYFDSTRVLKSLIDDVYSTEI